MKNKVLLSGITGQAGVTFAQKFMGRGDTVIGMYRRTANSSFGRLEEAGLMGHNNLVLESGDVTDLSSIVGLVTKYRPNIIGNLAASSHVGESFENPIANLENTGKGCLNMLEAIRQTKSSDYNPKFWTMSSSEMMGSNFIYGGHAYSVDTEEGRKILCEHQDECYQNETTPLSANSPYAAAKIYAHNMTELYRRGYGLFANSIICFNFEGPYRGHTFVTRKITQWIAQYRAWRARYSEYPLSFGVDDIVATDFGAGNIVSSFPKLRLGNIDAYRDWTYVEDMANAVLLSLEQEKPDTYCVCSESTHSVREFLQVAFAEVGITNFNPYIVIDSKLFRPVEVPFLRGRSTKIQSLGWKPETSFESLVKIMVEKYINRCQI